MPIGYRKEKVETLTAKEALPLHRTESKTPSPESLTRQTWLNYYNDYLLEHGVISEEMWRKMRLVIGRT